MDVDRGVKIVEDFIKEKNLKADILEFEVSTETVSKAAEAVGISHRSILKTLLMKTDEKLLAVLICGERRADYKKIKKIVKSRRLKMLTPDEIELYTPFKIGGVSPLFNKIFDFHRVIDENCFENEFVILGGGDDHHLVKISLKKLIGVLDPLIADVTR